MKPLALLAPFGLLAVCPGTAEPAALALLVAFGILGALYSPCRNR